VLAAVPARAAEGGEGATPGGLIVLLLVMGVALVLAGVTGYVLRLVAGLGDSSRPGATGRTAGPETFAPYLEELDGAQLDALQHIHAPNSLPTLLIHDHAKEQLV
jgi:hypothetical protein